MRYLWRHSSGASVIEYVIGLGVIMVAVMVAMSALKGAAKSRAESSQNTVSTMVPCEGALGVDTDGDPTTIPEQCL